MTKVSTSRDLVATTLTNNNLAIMNKSIRPHVEIDDRSPTKSKVKTQPRNRPRRFWTAFYPNTITKFGPTYDAVTQQRPLATVGGYTESKHSRGIDPKPGLSDSGCGALPLAPLPVSPTSVWVSARDLAPLHERRLCCRRRRRCRRRTSLYAARRVVVVVRCSIC